MGTCVPSHFLEDLNNDALPGRIDPQFRMAPKNIKIHVIMKNGHTSANRDSAYQTIDQLTNSLSLAATKTI